MMRVFKIGDCDWVCAESLDQAIKYYKNDILGDFDDEINIDDVYVIMECDIEKETMWYGFDFYNSTKESNRLEDFFHIYKDKTYKIKYDKRGDFDCVVKLTFKEVLELDNPTEPYIIASTEY